MAKRPERILIVPDAHHPYSSRNAWRVLLKAGRLFKPDRIICLGDFGDFYACSSHRKDPAVIARLKTEIRACRAARSELDALGAKRKYFVMGNHEDRFARYIADRAPELHGLEIGDEELGADALLGLTKNDWHVTPYGDVLRVGKVYYAHDPSGASTHAHHLAGVAAGHPIVHGHTHRAASVYMGNLSGEKRIAMMCGWLGDPAKATYVHKVPQRHSWMHAFALGWLEPNGTTHIQLVPIVHGRACVNGQMVAA